MKFSRNKYLWQIIGLLDVLKAYGWKKNQGLDKDGSRWRMGIRAFKLARLGGDNNAR
jgi:hypothetical protein